MGLGLVRGGGRRSGRGIEEAEKEIMRETGETETGKDIGKETETAGEPIVTNMIETATGSDTGNAIVIAIKARTKIEATETGQRTGVTTEYRGSNVYYTPISCLTSCTYASHNTEQNRVVWGYCYSK
jgi:hypothetical protein